jgi:hypothetical protein
LRGKNFGNKLNEDYQLILNGKNLGIDSKTNSQINFTLPENLDSIGYIQFDRAGYLSEKFNYVIIPPIITKDYLYLNTEETFFLPGENLGTSISEFDSLLIDGRPAEIMQINPYGIEIMTPTELE